MTRTGPTRRKLGNIRPQLWVSACVLLLPPLVIAAGVMVLGSSPRNGTEPEGAAQQAAASQTTVTKSVSLAERPDGATSFALASAEQHPVITEQHPVAGRSPMTEQHVATEQSPVSGQPPVAKDPSRYDASVPVTDSDPTRYYGPIPVTLVHVWKSREQSAMADIEAAPSTVTAAHALPAATRIHASHVSRGMGRHEQRSVYRVKQERARSLNEPRRKAGVQAPASARAGVRRAQRYQNRYVR
jgi:hypothetical protein